MRLTHLVNYDCLLLIERVEKRINCIEQNAQQGNCTAVKHIWVISFCINVVSAVRYSEKTKSLHFWTSSWSRTGKNRGHLDFVEISILIHQSILACSLARVKFVARDDWHLTSDALIGYVQPQGRFWPYLRVHLSSLRCWSFCGNNVRLVKVSQVKNTQVSPLEVHFKCTSRALEKSSVKPPFMITYTC